MRVTWHSVYSIYVHKNAHEKCWSKARLLTKLYRMSGAWEALLLNTSAYSSQQYNIHHWVLLWKNNLKKYYPTNWISCIVVYPPHPRGDSWFDFDSPNSDCVWFCLFGLWFFRKDLHDIYDPKKAKNILYRWFPHSIPVTVTPRLISIFVDNSG